MDLQRLNLDYFKVTVHHFNRVIRCFDCLGFGHTSIFCPMKADIGSGLCFHCGKHKLAECTIKDNQLEAACCNRVRANTKLPHLCLM